MRQARSPLLTRSAAYFAAPPSSKRRWPKYLFAMAGVAAATAIAWFAEPILNEPNIVMIYLLTIALVALRLGRGPAISASIASTLAYNFFFVPPIFTLNIADGQYLITFAVLMGVGIIIAQLMTSVRLQARVAGYRERRTALLYAMSRELAATRGAANIARGGCAPYRRSVRVAMRGAVTRCTRQAAVSKCKAEPASLRSADLSVAQWVHDHNQPAGLGTDTLPGAAARYLPLQASVAKRGALE